MTVDEIATKGRQLPDRPRAPGGAGEADGAAPRDHARWRPGGETLVLAALLLAPFLAFWRLLAPGAARRYFPDGDFVDQFFAFAHYEVARLAGAHLPLWNPYAYGGGPFWGDIQSAVAYPPSLANALANAVVLHRMSFTALELEAVLHLGLAGAFTYLFARRAIGSAGGALVAAVVFGFSGYLTGYPMLQLAVIESIVWLPLALLGIERLDAPDEEGWRIGVAVLATALACSVLGGHPQSTLYVAYVTVAYGAWRLRPWEAKRRRLLRPLAVAALLATLASAATWLPAAQFLRLSNRATIDYEAVAHGFAPRELAGALLPGLTHFAPLYVSLAALLLAAGAVAAWAFEDAATGGRALKSVPFWLVLAALALLLSLGSGSPVFDALYVAAPGWGMFRGQERAAAVVAFSAAMLAGSGAALWLGGSDRVRRVVLYGAPVLAGALVVVMAVGRTELQPLALRGLVVALLLAGLAAWGRPPVRPAPWLVALLAIIALDLLPVATGTNLVAGRPAELTPNPVTAMLDEILAERLQNDDREPPNFGLLHDVESTGGASPLWLRGPAALRDRLGGDNPRLWDLLAVSHVLTWRGELPVPAESLIETGADESVARLFQIDAVPQRAWRVAKAEVLDDDSALERLAAPDFDPYGTVLLANGEAASYPASTGGLAVSKAGPGRLAARTEGDAPGWLVFSEMHYPGWRATLDGTRVPVLRADYTLMAVALPPGAHEVVLEFAPRIVAWAIALSLVGWLLIARLVVGPRFERAGTPGAEETRRRAQAPPGP